MTISLKDASLKDQLNAISLKNEVAKLNNDLIQRIVLFLV